MFGADGWPTGPTRLGTELPPPRPGHATPHQMEGQETAKTGTTTVGIVCDGGVVLGTDTRATLGRMIGHKAVQKMFKIADHLGMTVAGSVGDAQALVRISQLEAELYRARRESDMTVKAMATYLGNLLNRYKFAPFFTQLIVGGVDAEGGHVFSLDAAGGAIPDNYVSTGSGSIFVYGVLEDRWEEGLSIEDGIDLAIRGISAAMNRDSASGNSILMCTITAEDGYQELDIDDIKSRVEDLGIKTPFTE